MMRRLVWMFCFLAACGDDEPAQCRATAPVDYSVKSGWEATGYAPTPTDLGCYPYRKSATETFGKFISMRTSATPQMSIDKCADIFESLNCATYEGDAGKLTFNVGKVDRLTMDVTGSFNGTSVDTTLYFNPCQPGCLAAITLQTIDAAQQKVCEIPSQTAECLFPDAAHTITFGRIGLDSIELRLAGKSYALQNTSY